MAAVQVPGLDSRKDLGQLAANPRAFAQLLAEAIGRGREGVDAAAVALCSIDPRQAAQAATLLDESASAKLAAALDQVGPLSPARIESAVQRLLHAEEHDVCRFAYLDEHDPAEIVGGLQDEHPQTIALVLAAMPVGRASQTFAQLPEALKADVGQRIEAMRPVREDVIDAVESALQVKFGEASLAVVGGAERLALLQREISRTTGPSVRWSSGFDLLAKCDEHTIDAILHEVEMTDLVAALGGASEAVREAVLRRLSSRARSEFELLEARTKRVSANTRKEAREKLGDLARRFAA